MAKKKLIKNLALRAAYRKMLAKSAGQHRGGMPLRSWLHKRDQLRQGKYPTEWIMRKWLLKAGWSIDTEERWAVARDSPLGEAFRELLQQRLLAQRLGVALNKITNARNEVALGNYPSAALMRAWLKKLGWRCSVEERWSAPRR